MKTPSALDCIFRERHRSAPGALLCAVKVQVQRRAVVQQLRPPSCGDTAAIRAVIRAATAGMALSESLRR